MFSEAVKKKYFKNKLAWTLSGLLLLSIWQQTVLYFLNYDLSVPSDTSSFLELLAMVRGHLPENYMVPFRIDNPLYSLSILISDSFINDWLNAAKIAALIPSILTPVVLGLIAWSIDKSVFSVLIAGLLGTFSVSLSSIGLFPLSDSLFILFSALTLMTLLQFIESKSLIHAFFAALFAGLSWSTRGPGLFYIIVVFSPLIAMYIQCRSSDINENNESRLHVYKLMLVVFFTFCISGKATTIYFSSYANDRKPNDTYLKSAFINGIQYAEGASNYEKSAYTLNKSASGYSSSDDMASLSWMELINKYGKQQARTFIINLERNFSEVLPQSLAPFFLIFLPLSIGFIYIWKRNKREEILVLFFMALPYLLIIPAIQLHLRYIYPIACVCLPVTAIGIKQIYFSSQPENKVSLFFSRGLVAFIILMYISLNSFTLVKNNIPAKWPTLYHSASKWILTKHGEDISFSVMSRYHGVYAHLNGKVSKTSLPVNDINSVATYCRNTNTRYIFMGPVEFSHNPKLKEILKDEPTTVGDITFSIAEIFSVEGYVLGLVKVDWPH